MNTIVRRHRHTPEHAVRKIREGERLLHEAQDLAEVPRPAGEQLARRLRGDRG
jgi:hypothetical protein